MENSNQAPKGATHRYEHGGLISWYLETDLNGLFVWRDGSWHGASFKNTKDLMESCMLGKLTLLAMEQAQPVEDDLTWLARNRLDWPDGLKAVLNPIRFVLDVMPGEKHITRDQWLARRAELQKKPSWADARPWAKWLSQSEDGEWWFSLDKPECVGNKWRFNSSVAGNSKWKGEVIGDWRDTLERRPADQSELAEVDTEFLMRSAGYYRLRDVCRIMRDQPDNCKTEAVDAVYKISRELLIQRNALPGDLSSKALVATSAVQLLRNDPHMFSANELADLHQLCDAELTKRDAAVCGGQKYLDAHWFERGELPPVGVVCEAISEPDMDWFEVEVIAHRDGFAIVWCGDEKCGANCDDPKHFRPIRTERERLGDIIKETRHSLRSDTEIVDAILAAGFKLGGGE